MRELIFKTSTSTENKKRDLWVEETVEKDGVLAKTQRRCLYFIIGKAHIDNPDDIESVSALKFHDRANKKRHYYILKEHNDANGEDRLVCKISGTFYAVCGNDVYCIAFVHAFKLIFTADSLNKGKG